MALVKRCKICNDIATGFHYDILACNSCKTFFFRNGSSQTNKFKCKATGNCEITPTSRRKCRSCRLEKCFKLGMIGVNEVRLEQQNQLSQLEENSDQTLLETLFTRTPTFLISPFTPIKCLSPPGNRNYDLSDFENGKIKEMLDALSVIINEQTLPVQGSYTTDMGVGYVEFYIRQYIKFTNRLEAFTALSEADQLAIIKPFYFDIMMTRFAFLYDFELDGWPVVLNENATNAIFIPFHREKVAKFFEKCAAEILQQPHCVNFFEFTRSLQAEMEGDPIIRDLLIVFLLFKNQTATSCPEYIRYHFLLHYRLLQRYLEYKHRSIKLARHKLHSLIKLIMEFPQIRELERSLFAVLDINKMPHLYIELMDLTV